LQHVPRYLKAINVRLEKLHADAARDARQWVQMQALQQAWQRALGGQQTSTQHAGAQMEEFGWMLQELRVSLFAQELKTPVIVSVKRLQKMWEGIKR
jgi:ATP-dependent helicase HrpA